MITKKIIQVPTCILIVMILSSCSKDGDKKSSAALSEVIAPVKQEALVVIIAPEHTKPFKEVKTPPVTAQKPEVVNRAVEDQKSSVSLTSKPAPISNKSSLPPCPISGPRNNCIGTFIDASNGIEYIGEYQDDKWNGQGIMTLPSGIKYEGNWKNSKMDGKGTMTFVNGSKFIGEYRENKQHGQGVLSRADGSIVQQGVWESGKFIGLQ